VTKAPAEGVPAQQSAVIAAAGAGAALVIAASLLAFAAVNWPSADDFCNTVLVKEGGISGAMHWLYTQWSGRLLTGIALYSTFATVDIPSLRDVSVLLAALFLLCVWQVSTFVAPRDTPARLVVAGFTVAALTLGLYGVLGQAVFWPTGGIVYLIPLVLLLHWLHGMRNLLDDGTRSTHALYWLAISIALGNSIELVIPVAIVYAVVVTWPRWRSLSPAQRRSVVLRVIGIALGASVLVSAPGNFLRGNATPNSFDLSPALLLREYARLLATALRTGGIIVVLAMILASIGLVLASRRRMLAETRWRESLALALGGLATLVPVLAAPAQFAPRNGLYLLVCLLVAGLLMFVPQLERGRGASFAYACLAAAAMAGALIVAERMVKDFELASLRRDQHIARDSLLRDPGNRGRAIVVKPIRPYPPATLHAIDITPDRGQIVNQCVARYYDLASVELARDAAAP